MGQMLVLASVTTSLLTVLDRYSSVVQFQAVKPKNHRIFDHFGLKSPHLDKKCPPNWTFLAEKLEIS